MERFLSTVQVAKRLGVSRMTVYRWIKEGKMKAERAGRNFVVEAKEVEKAKKLIEAGLWG